MHDHSLSQQGDAAEGSSEAPSDASCPEPADRLAAARGILVGLALGLAFWMAAAVVVIVWLRRT